eukprot:359586-Chlamydomonas_euryale.AAC.23
MQQLSGMLSRQVNLQCSDVAAEDMCKAAQQHGQSVQPKPLTVILDMLSISSASDNKHGDGTKISPQRVFLAMINMAHQHNTAMVTGNHNAATGAHNTGQLGRRWLPVDAWLRLQRPDGTDAAGTSTGATESPMLCHVVLDFEQRQGQGGASHLDVMRQS